MLKKPPPSPYRVNVTPGSLYRADKCIQIIKPVFSFKPAEMKGTDNSMKSDCQLLGLCTRHFLTVNWFFHSIQILGYVKDFCAFNAAQFEGLNNFTP